MNWAPKGKSTCNRWEIRTSGSRVRCGRTKHKKDGYCLDCMTPGFRAAEKRGAMS